MNLLYLALLGFVIGSTLFFIEPVKKRGTFLGNVLLGVTGAIVGGIYANLFFGISFDQLGVTGLLVVLFSAVLLWFVGRIIRNVG